MEKWKLKAFLKIVIKVSVSWILILMLVEYTGIGYARDVINFTIYLSCGICGGAILVFLVNNYIKRRNEVDTKNFFREIEDEYTPAIASFMLDYKIEYNEVILATILDLHVKKYLKILKKDKELQIEVINKDKDKLYAHEKYIISCLEQNKLIDMYEFNNLVEKDCENINLVNKKNTKTILGILFLIFVGILFFLVIVEEIIDTGPIFVTDLVLVIILYWRLKTKRYHNRTNEGEIVATKFKGLKNYLKEYTLLPERDINYLDLSERYLPFALALGVANKLENNYTNYIEYNSLISKYIKGGK